MNLRTKRLYNKLQKKKKELDLIKSEISTLAIKLQEVCEHPEDEIEDLETYFSGSYYDRATTTHWRKCKTCGLESESVTESHDWYG